MNLMSFWMVLFMVRTRLCRNRKFRLFIFQSRLGILGYAVTENLGYLYFNQDYVYTDLAYIRLTPMIALFFHFTLFGIIMGKNFICQVCFSIN